MKVHRFIVDIDLTPDELRITERTLVNQIRNVLKLAKGEALILSRGEGDEVRGVITELGGGFVKIAVEERMRNANEPERTITLYLSVLKRENFELAAQKATEVGVSEIVPILSSRTVKFGMNRERVEKIIREAAEQSGRGKIPTLREPQEFGRIITEAAKNDLNLFFDVSGIPFEEKLIAGKRTIGIFIGPEGGWGNKELVEAKENGCVIARLGALTLRAETAATIASFLVSK